jgi:hypothetical protein
MLRIVLVAAWRVLKSNPGGLYAWLARYTAAGAFGTWAQRIYLGLIGRKTKIGMVIGLLYFAASIACSAGLHLGCQTVTWIGDASVAMLGWGVLDSSARADPPVLSTTQARDARDQTK